MNRSSAKTSRRAIGWARFHVKTMLVLVVCVASLLMAWRSYLDLNPSQKLARQLRYDRQPESRAEAARELGQADPNDAETIIPVLRIGLRDTDPRVRLASAAAIKIHLQSWVPALRSPDPRGDLPTILALLDAAENRDPELRQAAFLTLAVAQRPIDWTSEIPKPIADILVRGATAADPSIREAAILTLGSPAWRLPESKILLLKAINDADPRVRIAAAHAIEAGGFACDRSLFLALLATLNDHDPLVRRKAWTGPGAKSVSLPPPLESIPILTKALPKPESRLFARIFLLRLEGLAAPAVPALIELLEDDQPAASATAVADAAVVLASIGRSAVPAVPALIACFQRTGSVDPPSRNAREALAEALSELASSDPRVLKLAESLADQLKNANFHDNLVRSDCFALGHLGRGSAAAKDVAQKLLAAAKAANGDDRLALFRALSAFTWDDEAIMPEFRRLLNEKSLARDGRLESALRGWIGAEERRRNKAIGNDG